MSMRGIKTPAPMTTSVPRGIFRYSLDARMEFKPRYSGNLERQGRDNGLRIPSSTRAGKFADIHFSRRVSSGASQPLLHLVQGDTTEKMLDHWLLLAGII